MTLYMIRTSFGIQINCYFCSTYAFSSVKIDAEIDEVCRSENVDGTKHASCLNSWSSMTLYLIRASFRLLWYIIDQLWLQLHLRLLSFWVRRWDWWGLWIGKRWWNQACILFKLLIFNDALLDQSFLQTTLFHQRLIVTSVPRTSSLLLRSTLRLMRSANRKMLMEPSMHLA
jgi:hypothetical protein